MRKLHDHRCRTTWFFLPALLEYIGHFPSSIEGNSAVFTDDTDVYDRFLNAKGCRHIAVEDDNRDSVNHINNVNSFHSAIDQQNMKYRGVSTKYLNRCCALFRMQRECQGMDRDETLIHVLGKLRKILSFFPVKDHQDKDIFQCTPDRPHQLAMQM